MTGEQQQVLKAELEPEAANKRRRRALGRGLGALLLRGRLRSAAEQMPYLQVPAWASDFEPPQKAWIKKVLRNAHKV